MTHRDSPPRVVLAKGGLDAHERGVHVLALGLRDAGFEVMYLGLRRTPAEVVRTAIQEDADIIGISTLSSGYRRFVRQVLDGLNEQDADIPVVVGGLVMPEDQTELLDWGVRRIFGSGSLVSEIAAYLNELVQGKAQPADGARA